jgi:hypothetical protein
LARQRSFPRDTLERVQFDIAVAGSWAGWVHKKRRCCGCKRAQRARCECEGKKIMGNKVLNPCLTHSF